MSTVLQTREEARMSPSEVDAEMRKVFTRIYRLLGSANVRSFLRRGPGAASRYRQHVIAHIYGSNDDVLVIYAVDESDDTRLWFGVMNIDTQVIRPLKYHTISGNLSEMQDINDMLRDIDLFRYKERDEGIIVELRPRHLQ